MPTKKLTPPRPTLESRKFSPFPAAIPCSAFARSSIPPRVRPSCMCWVSIARTGTIWLFAGSASADEFHSRPHACFGHCVTLGSEGTLHAGYPETRRRSNQSAGRATHPRGFRHFMHENLFAHVNVNSRNIHIPDGTIRGNYDEYCASYENSIRK